MLIVVCARRVRLGKPRPMQPLLLLAACVLLASAAGVAAQPPAPVSLVAPHTATTELPAVPTRALFDQYCVACHNDRLRQGDLSLVDIDPAHPAAHAAALEKVIRKLRAGLMPPARRPRPDEATVAAFVDGLEHEIDRAAAADPNPGRPVLHRLNRTEYANAVRDLLGLEVKVESLLPPDDMSQGYDNMSDVLTVSPALLEGYISAAGKISRLAVGDPGATPLVETYLVPQAVSQLRHVPGTPFSAGIGWRGNFSQNVPDSWMQAVHFLMEIGADVNAVDTNGYTALHGAAALGNDEMVEFLVARGATVDAINEAGNSPADMAFGPSRFFIPKPDTAALLVGLGSSFQNDCRSDQCVDGKFFGGAVTAPR